MWLSDSPLNRAITMKPREYKAWMKAQEQISRVEKRLDFSFSQADGLGRFRHVAFEYGFKNIKTHVDMEIQRLGHGKTHRPAYSKALDKLMEEFRKSLEDFVSKKQKVPLPRAIPVDDGRDVYSSDSAKFQGDIDFNAQQKVFGWKISGKVLSVSKKLENLTRQDLGYGHIASSYDSQFRTIWDSPLSQDDSNELNFFCVRSIADSVFMTSDERAEWNREREELKGMIGALSDNLEDEYFCMRANQATVAVCQVERVQIDQRHYAIIHNYWRFYWDRYEVGYLLEGLMSWLDDMRSAQLYVFAAQEDRRLFEAMQFFKVEELEDSLRLESKKRTAALSVLMSIRLNSWISDAPYVLDFQNCQVETNASRELDRLLQDLRDTNAIELIRLMAFQSYFLFLKKQQNKQKKGAKTQSAIKANKSDQVQTPKFLLNHIAKVVRLPNGAFYDNYQFNSSWEDGRNMNAIKTRSQAPVAQISNPPYSGAASHLFFGAYLNAKCRTSSVYIVPKQSAENKNVGLVLQALGTLIPAGTVRFQGFSTPLPKEITLVYILSPPLIRYREWLMQEYRENQNSKIPKSMTLRCNPWRQVQQEDIARRLLKAGATQDTAAALAKIARSRVTTLAKMLAKEKEQQKRDEASDQ